MSFKFIKGYQGLNYYIILCEHYIYLRLFYHNFSISFFLLEFSVNSWYMYCFSFGLGLGVEPQRRNYFSTATLLLSTELKRFAFCSYCVFYYFLKYKRGKFWLWFGGQSRLNILCYNITERNKHSPAENSCYFQLICGEKDHDIILLTFFYMLAGE